MFSTLLCPPSLKSCTHTPTTSSEGEGTIPSKGREGVENFVFLDISSRGSVGGLV